MLPAVVGSLVLRKDVFVLGITQTASSVVHLAKAMAVWSSSHECVPLATCLEDMDIPCRIRVVEGLVMDMEDVAPRYRSVTRALVHMHETLRDMQNLLKTLKDRTSQVQHLWFASWRGHDLAEDIATLRVLSTRLDQRLGMLMKVFPVVQCVSSSSSEGGVSCREAAHSISSPRASTAKSKLREVTHAEVRRGGRRGVNSSPKSI